MSVATYLYRCTEQQMEEHLRRIAEAGDTVEHVIYKGGRDYVLVCRKAEGQPVVFPYRDQLQSIISTLTVLNGNITTLRGEIRAADAHHNKADQ